MKCNDNNKTILSTRNFEKWRYLLLTCGLNAAKRQNKVSFLRYNIHYVNIICSHEITSKATTLQWLPWAESYKNIDTKIPIRISQAESLNVFAMSCVGSIKGSSKWRANWELVAKLTNKINEDYTLNPNNKIELRDIVMAWNYLYG